VLAYSVLPNEFYSILQTVLLFQGPIIPSYGS